jgi:tetratricopeptide (TPR) repeat protein
MNRVSRNGAIATLLLALAVAPDASAQPAHDPMAEFRLDEAMQAMSNGEFQRALDLCLVVLVQDERDARAHREAGRAAHALGRLQIAIDHLERALELEAGARDPEAHYLLGEAYYVSGRKDEAIRQHDQVRREVARDTSDTMELMWLARIHARRHELREANRIYGDLLRRAPDSIEVRIARIEAHTLSGHWGAAEKLLREFIADHPDHERAEEMLAWVLESEGKTEEERALRARLASEPAGREGSRRILDHARALERNGNYHEAIVRYEQALQHNDDPESDVVDELEVRAAVARLRYQLTPETFAGGGTFTDPSGSVYRLRTGVAIPAGDHVTLGLLGSMEWAAGGAAPGAMPTSDVRAGTIDATTVFGQSGPVAAAFTASGSFVSIDGGDSSPRIGVGVDTRVGQGKALQLHTSANVLQPWRETASTVREGGRETGVTSVLYALPFGPRLIFDGGVRWRYMALEPIDKMESTGTQTMVFGGADWVAWAPSTRAGRGQFLDEDLRWSTGYLADSLTLSYRHFEAFTDDEFGGRLTLAERDTIDELSAVARNSWPDGLFGLELRAGGGRDWARDIQLWRVGSSVLFTPVETLRASLTYDYAQESTSGFSGERHTAWASLHLDL